MRLLIVLFYLALQADPRSAGTKQMTERLPKVYAETDWKADPNKQLERAAYYRAVLQQDLNLPTKLQARLYLGQMLLQAGKSVEAASELETLRATVAAQKQIVAPAFDHELRSSLAMAYLRQGEQRNCQKNHNADSCVYPLRNGGIHQDSYGARRAALEWAELLKKYPDDGLARWLINVAYMAAGERTPDKWRVSESFLDSEFDIGRFLDVAGAVGVATLGHAGGVVAEDFDGDGLFDLIVSSSGPLDQLRYFHNNGDGTFTDQTVAAGLEGEVGGLNVIHADYNNDGYPDLLVLRGGWAGKNGHYPFSLLRNNGPNARGQITFSDVTEEAGLLSFHPTQTAAWADFDGDGWLDLFVGNESSKDDPNPSALWHNNHDGTFTDIAPAAGLANAGFVKGAAWGDYNNDGRPDLYISRDGAPNLLLRNDGPKTGGGWKFTDVTETAGVSHPVYSFACWFFDYDNDGWPDLLVTGYYPEKLDQLLAFHLEQPNQQVSVRLYHNNGNGTFRDVSKETRINRVMLTMGAGFGDLDNDGWLDCYFGTGSPQYEALLPNRMFRNDHGKRFQDVTTSGGFGNLQKGHAIAFADFNRDGQQDVFEVLGGAAPGDMSMSTLLGNPGHAKGWLDLKLEGTKSNRSAIGARVTVEVENLDGERQSFYRTVNTGTSFGDSPLELHVGVGEAQTIRAVTVRWPSGLKQSFKGLDKNSRYKLTEGQPAAERCDVKAFLFARSDDHKHSMSMQ